RADVADDRDALAELGAGEAAHREQYDRHQNVRRHAAGSGEARDQAEANQVDRNRHDADLEIDDLPPAFGPEARRGGTGRGGLGGRGRRHWRLLRIWRCKIQVCAPAAPFNEGLTLSLVIVYMTLQETGIMPEHIVID